MGVLLTSLSIRHFDNDNENSKYFQTLWTERFCTEQNPFENKMKRFGNRTKYFENGTLLRSGSTLQDLYKYVITCLLGL